MRAVTEVIKNKKTDINLCPEGLKDRVNTT